MYKTVVVEYYSGADYMAAMIEEKANEMLEQGYELVTVTETSVSKSILIFKKKDEPKQ